MSSAFAQLLGSFERADNFPLEANYIFPTLEDLKQFYSDEISKATLHKGLLKVVEKDDTGKQALYWVTAKVNEATPEAEPKLVFEKLVGEGDTGAYDKLQSIINAHNGNVSFTGGGGGTFENGTLPTEQQICRFTVSTTNSLTKTTEYPNTTLTVYKTVSDYNGTVTTDESKITIADNQSINNYEYPVDITDIGRTTYRFETSLGSPFHIDVSFVVRVPYYIWFRKEDSSEIPDDGTKVYTVNSNTLNEAIVMEGDDIKDSPEGRFCFVACPGNWKPSKIYQKTITAPKWDATNFTEFGPDSIGTFDRNFNNKDKITYSIYKTVGNPFQNAEGLQFKVSANNSSI